ncbi:MAG: hypothetical protein SWQ30_21990 [Thermodesulfobacteriota bacterium]|nr:hypothetical protein [Thermodesulfobacteriota bacterium]
MKFQWFCDRDDYGGLYQPTEDFLSYPSTLSKGDRHEETTQIVLTQLLTGRCLFCWEIQSPCHLLKLSEPHRRERALEMKKHLLAVVLIAEVLYAGFPVAAHAASYTFTTIDIPDPSFFVTVTGIGNGGEIVGYYEHATYGNTYGFVLEGDDFTRMDHPDGRNTFITGISNAGQLVGYYEHATHGNTYGFVLEGSTFSQIAHPNAQNTGVMGIGHEGQLVGYYEHATYGNTYGFVFQDDAFTKIEAPATTVTVATDVGSGGRTVGYYHNTSSGWTEGFILEGGSYDTFHPDDSYHTAIMGIGTGDQIVGYYMHTPASTATSGFVLEGDSFTTIDVPEARSTRIMGIGSGGQIVGDYNPAVPSSTERRGFIGTPVPIPVTVWLLGSGLIGLLGIRRISR